ncbi:PREDICTED: xaa-Pro aminopeptidase 1-like, partial [Rhagoletis zephyria]|uniref:xaa-Pro aminopeptidase 1-like n=1 Tax=Rhagoletis zephyria TaxID=28612 RepID=UPI00081153FB
MLRTVMRSGGSGGAASSAAAHHQHSSSSDSALQALVVPTADAHGSEYIAPCDARREYLTKFTGSAGTAVVTLKEAALWTDGRYFLQAVAEMDPASWVLMKDRLPGTATIGEWLNEVLAAEGGGARVGADPYTMSYEGWLRLERELAEGGNLLVATPANLVDAVWGSGRPARPSEPVLPLDIAFTGRRWQEKVEEVRGEMRAKGASLLVLTALDDVAWLLNLRGADIEYNPVFFAYAIVTLEKTVLFIEESKLTASALAHLQQPTDDPMDSLPASSTSSNSSSPNHSNRSTPNGANLDGKSAASEMSNKSSYALVNLVPESRRLLTGVSPVTARKAIKNEVEIAGMRRAH